MLDSETPVDPAASSPSRTLIAVSYVAVVLAGIAAWFIFKCTDPDPLIVDADAFTVFAPLYVAAQAIERFLEPLAARTKPTTKEKAEVKKAIGDKEVLEAVAGLVADASVEDPKGELEEADEKVGQAERELGRAKSQRAVVLWAAASALGLLVCACLGLGLIEAVSKTASSSDFVRTVDVLLTGLAVGAGTKPLHDLISRLEKAKENADPATKPAAASG